MITLLLLTSCSTLFVYAPVCPAMDSPHAVANPQAVAVNEAEPHQPGTDELADLTRDLRDSQNRARRTAVQGLAKLGTIAAWEAIAGALADPDPMVADEAQMSLWDADSEERLEILTGKQALASRKDLVRLRAIEALGHAKIAVDAQLFRSALSGKSSALRRAALWSIEGLATEEHLGGDVERALFKSLSRMVAKDKDPEVRAAALMALVAALPAEAQKTLSAARSDREAVVRAASLRVDQDAARNRSALGDGDARVRRVALELLEARADRAGVGALIERLAIEPEKRLLWSLVQCLRRLSGLRHGADVRPWRAWAQELAADWQPAPFKGGAAGKGGADGELGDRTSAFAGLTLLSDRTTFLVDFSGSLWQERDGKSRKEIADRELRRALESLPEDALFNVIPFATEPDPWAKELVSASPKNVKRALKDFEANRTQGKGNFWSALELALEDPAVDTIIVLTDGAPTGGERWNVELMVDLFAERNRFRRVVLEAVLIDCRGRLHGYWEDLCAGAGGRIVDLKL